MSSHPSAPAITRREFLARSAASVVATPLTGLALEAANEAPRPWYATMRRCGQINFNERDPLTLDAEAWMDYWASLKLNAVLLNGGGIMAFYPTEVPYHHRSQFLGARDLFGDMVAAATQRGIRAVARMDCNYAYLEALEAHPEWFERHRDGSVRAHAECPWLYKTCMFSTYFTEQMPAIYREINRRYPVDGFFTNGWPSTGVLEVCYCANCRKIYDQIGGEPPATTDASSPVYRRYYRVYLDRVLGIWRQWDSIAREKQPDSVYVGNLGGGIHTVKSLKTLSEVAGWFNADHQGRSGDTPMWDCAQQGRVAQSVMNGRTITNVTGAYSNSSPLWRHVAKSPAETTMWLASTTASGMVPWFHWLGGSPEDQRWREVGRRFYDWLAANQPHFRNRRAIADLAVLYPQSTIAFYGTGAARGGWKPLRAEVADALQGLYDALLEGRFLFDFVHQENLEPQALARYRALLVPNAAYLRDQECAAIRAYVRGGGSLFATFETSRYNEWGDPRPDFALAGVFGASVAGEIIGPHGNSYMRIEQRNEVTRGFAGTEVLPGAENRVPIRQHDATSPPLTVVPYYPAFPPEMVYPRTPRTAEPAAVARQIGPSRVAYFPGDVCRTAWRSGNTDLARLIQNVVAWVAGDAPPAITVKGEGLTELMAWETEPGYALHILNYTNPRLTRGFIRQPYRIDPQQVEFTVAAGRSIRSVRALRAGNAVPFEQRGRRVRFATPAIEDYEVMALT